MLEHSILPFINEVEYIRGPLKVHRSLVSTSLSSDSVFFTFESRISVRRCYLNTVAPTLTYAQSLVVLIHLFFHPLLQ